MACKKGGYPNHVSESWFLWKTIIFRFHVSFRGCRYCKCQHLSNIHLQYPKRSIGLWWLVMLWGLISKFPRHWKQRLQRNLPSGPCRAWNDTRQPLRTHRDGHAGWGFPGVELEACILPETNRKFQEGARDPSYKVVITPANPMKNHGCKWV